MADDQQTNGQGDVSYDQATDTLNVSAPGSSDTDVLGEGEFDPSRLMAAVSYVGVLVFVPIFLKREDPFVNFHAKQGLVIFVGIVIAAIAARWISVIGSLLFVLMLIASILGLLQALLGRRWKIPGIGDIANTFNI